RSNGAAERAVRTVKQGLAAWSAERTHLDFNAYLQKVLLHHRASSCSRGQSPAQLVFGRNLRMPIASAFRQGDPVWYRPTPSGPSARATYLMTKGSNTYWILRDGQLVLASRNQVGSSCQQTEEDDLPFPQIVDRAAEQAEEPRVHTHRQQEEVDRMEIERSAAETLRRSQRTRRQPDRLNYA
ncbi:MAG: hypothetical protein V2I33_17635, partial [Kangiellaceae bacterium]|nr:hypothetical protein [Kangiellaceae bacterium]